jgi:hypothetical protein
MQGSGVAISADRDARCARTTTAFPCIPFVEVLFALELSDADRPEGRPQHYRDLDYLYPRSESRRSLEADEAPHNDIAQVTRGKGMGSADLPVVPAVPFELNIPESVLLLADEVIE